MEALLTPLLSALLLSLRIGPTLAFAPPFTLLRVPVLVRVLLGVSLAYWMGPGAGFSTLDAIPGPIELAVLVGQELFFGIALALALQLCFAAIYMAGRTIDIQAGFGLALLADPATRTQTPLIGTVLAYVTAVIFFAVGGATSLVEIWASSIRLMPLGSVGGPQDLSLVLNYLGTVFVLATGLAGLILLSLFLIDMTVAFLSRTLPQMNVLLLGFQVKTMVLMAVLPLTIATSSALFLRLVRVSLDSTPRFI